MLPRTRAASDKMQGQPICPALSSSPPHVSLASFRERIVRRREFITLLGSAAAIRPLDARSEHPVERILYFTRSAGYRHDVIPLSKVVLTRLGRKSGVFEVTVTEETSALSIESLKRYAAVKFDVGTADNLIAANREIDAAMTRGGITHTFETYEGDHNGKIAERLETKVMPFFSANLAFK